MKMTLLDFPGRVACTVFTAGCNLRCPFCHNAFLVTKLDPAHEFTHEEILDHLSKRKKVLDGVAVTGGEPLMYPDTIDFLRKIRALGYQIKLDTNGTYPERLKEILDEGIVDYVAMDVKNTPEKYAQTVGLKDFDPSPVLQSIELLRGSGIDHEFRTTVVRQFHTAEDIVRIAQMLGRDEKYFLQNFVDSGNLIDGSVTGVDPSEMREMCEAARAFVPSVSLRGM